MKEYEDMVVNEYLKPCPHCGFEKPHARRYAGEDDFPDKYAILCDYSEGGCGAESGHYHTLLEAILMWNKRTEETSSKLVKVPLELTKQRVRSDLTEFVIHQLKPCMRRRPTEVPTTVDYMDIACNIDSYDDSWCDRHMDIDLRSEIDGIVNQIMDKLFDKA